MTLQTSLLPSACLAEFYRFALLLTGYVGGAEGAVAATMAEAEKRVADVRDVAQRAAWFAMRIRQRCLESREEPDADTGAAESEAVAFARQFHALPEPDRSALALFYIDPFTPDQIAQLLDMDLEQLGEALVRGRALLQRSLLPISQNG